MFEILSIYLGVISHEYFPNPDRRYDQPDKKIGIFFDFSKKQSSNGG